MKFTIKTSSITQGTLLTNVTGYYEVTVTTQILSNFITTSNEVTNLDTSHNEAHLELMNETY